MSGSQVEVNDIKNAFERGEVGINSCKIRQLFQPCGDGSTVSPRVPYASKPKRLPVFSVLSVSTQRDVRACPSFLLS